MHAHDQLLTHWTLPRIQSAGGLLSGTGHLYEACQVGIAEINGLCIDCSITIKKASGSRVSRKALESKEQTDGMELGKAMSSCQSLQTGS